MHKILSQGESYDILKPYLPTLNNIMQESLATLNKGMTAIGEPLNMRAKCSLLHSIATEKVKRAFNDDSSIIIKQRYQSIQIVFSQKVVGRIKKVNSDNLASNIKTSRNDYILSHSSQQMSLFPDLPPMTFLDIAYKIDSTFIEYDRLVIVCRVKDKVQWNIDYTNTSTVVNMNESEIQTISVKEESQIKIKKAQ